MTRKTKRSARLALAALITALAAAPSARGNGAFPDEFSVHFPAPAPHRILLGANFGLIISEDDGATWRYSCEPWITEGSDAALSGANVDFYQLCADGAVLAQSLHVTRSEDVGCNWPQSGGSILASNVFVRDLFPDPNDATFVLAILLDNNSKSLLVTSHDGGKTFDSPPVYTTPAILTGIEISQTTPGVFYATSIATSGGGEALLRSTDRGMTWTSTAIPAASGTEPRIMAVDPVDSGTVYLRVVGAQTDSVIIAHGGGQSFEPPFTINGQFAAFLRATDGSLYAGTQGGVLYTRAPGAKSFTNAPGPHLRCLGQRPGTSRIFACGDFFLDGFSLGTSDDGGKTFVRVMNFTDILGPLTCPTVATNCAAHWARIQSVLGIGDGGTGTAPDAGGAADAGGTTGAGTDAGAVSPPPSGSKKAGCSTAAAGGAAMICLLALLFRKRRR